MLLFLLLLHSAASGGAPACSPLQGGPAEGMCLGRTLWRKDDLAIVALQPAQRPGPAPSAEVAAVLARLLASQRAQAPLPPEIVTLGATSSFCTQFSPECQKRAPLVGWPLDRTYAANAPWLLPNGRVRIEWMHGGKLEYLSFVTLAGARVAAIDTAPAAMPMKTAAPGS
jgi:hypothetical protein